MGYYSKMTTKQRFYLVGDAFGSYRARALLGYLMASPSYTFHYTDPKFLTSKKQKLVYRVLFKSLRIFDRSFNLYKFLLSDVVYILPMSNLQPMEGFLAKALNKYVVGEFYISAFDTWVNDRKTVNINTSKANKLLKNDQRFIDICDQVIFQNASERDYYLNLIDREGSANKTSLTPLATNPKCRAQLPYVNLSLNSLTLCWWGTFIPLHGLEKIIFAAKGLKNKGIDFRLYLFGTSEEKSLPYKKQIEELDLETNVYIDNEKNFADKSLEKFLVDHCDIAFGNFGDSEKAKTVMVNKVVESASMGLPVISQRTKALGEYFTDNDSIFFCDSNPKAIAEKVVEIINAKQKLKVVAEGAYNLYSQRFTKEAYLEDVTEVLNNVCQSKK